MGQIKSVSLFMSIIGLCSVERLFRTGWVYIYTVGQTRSWISLSPGKEERQLRFTCFVLFNPDPSIARPEIRLKLGAHWQDVR